MTYKYIIKKILFNDNLIHNQYIIIKKSLPWKWYKLAIHILFFYIYNFQNLIQLLSDEFVKKLHI
jgi:hypothetical protein